LKHEKVTEPQCIHTLYSDAIGFMTVMKTTNVKKTAALCQVRYATSADGLRCRKFSRTNYQDIVSEMAVPVW